MTNNNMIFIANWKMNGDFKDILKVKIVSKLLSLNNFKKNKVIYCPPFTLLKKFYEQFKNSKIKVGAQNCHPSYEFGPYTGSINPKLIKYTGAQYVILGHSENRFEGEDDELINKKIKSAIKQNLSVIFCIGEKLSHKKKNLTFKIINKQISIGLKNIKNLKKIIIAYEPVWSIGTGIIPEPKDLEKIIFYIKKILKKINRDSKVNILYGGSVNSKNAVMLSSIVGIDGFLIGGASLNPKKFIDIIKKSTI